MNTKRREERGESGRRIRGGTNRERRSSRAGEHIGSKKIKCVI